MRNIFIFFASILAWLIFLLVFFFFFPCALVLWFLTTLFDKRKIILHTWTTLWALGFIFTNPFWNLKVTGRKKLKRDEIYVMICNHQSLLDILAVFGVWKQFKWVSKIELFKVPIVGWMLYLNDYIGIERGNKESAQLMMKSCIRAMSQGSSVMLFPEGTRSEDGNFRPFKEGAFKLAKAAERSILPIVVYGTANAVPKGSMLLKKRQTIHLEILDPISVDEVKRLEVRELLDISRDRMLQTYDKLVKNNL